MPDLVEQMYCSQQIIIPPNLPSILKKYAKAAIRTQPSDLLLWSSAYFHALKEGIPPPVKERFEYPPPISESGLSPGFLKVLINQLGKGDTVSRDTLENRWKGVCLNLEPLEELFKVGGFFDKIEWKKFIALAAGSIEPNLTRTMILFCELMTEEPEGGSASIPLDLFIEIYTYLAKLDCGPEDFRVREESKQETSCPEITAEQLPVVCDCKVEGPQKVTWEEALESKDTNISDELEESKNENDKKEENLEESNEKSEETKDEIVEDTQEEKKEESDEKEPQENVPAAPKEISDDAENNGENAQQKEAQKQEKAKEPQEQEKAEDPQEQEKAEDPQELEKAEEPQEAEKDGNQVTNEQVILDSLTSNDELEDSKNDAETTPGETQGLDVKVDDDAISKDSLELDVEKADLERIDSGFSVETVIVDSGNLFYTWPTIEDELEDMGNEDEISRYADSSYGLQVWDDPYGSSSYEMLYNEEKHMTEEDHKMFLTNQDTIVLEPPEDNLIYEEFTDEEISEADVRKKDGESEEMEDVFAPKIDSLREILDDEYVGEQEGEELEGVEQVSSQETLDVNPEEEEEEKELIQETIEDNIITIIQPDADIHHMPTPITSEISLVMDQQPETEAPVDTHDPSQQLAEKQSLIDVRVLVDEPLAPEAEKEEIQVRDPYWKQVPGIGPVVPDDVIEEVIKYLKEVASYQNQMVMPKNLRHFKCPPLEIVENQPEQKDSLY